MVYLFYIPHHYMESFSYFHPFHPFHVEHFNFNFDVHRPSSMPLTVKCYAAARVVNTRISTKLLTIKQKIFYLFLWRCHCLFSSWQLLNLRQDSGIQSNLVVGIYFTLNCMHCHCQCMRSAASAAPCTSSVSINAWSISIGLTRASSKWICIYPFWARAC